MFVNHCFYLILMLMQFAHLSLITLAMGQCVDPIRHCGLRNSPQLFSTGAKIRAIPRNNFVTFFVKCTLESVSNKNHTGKPNICPDIGTQKKPSLPTMTSSRCTPIITTSAPNGLFCCIPMYTGFIRKEGAITFRRMVVFSVSLGLLMF